LHNFREAGNAEYFVHVIGGTDDGKSCLTGKFAVYQAQAEKGGRNVFYTGKVEHKPGFLRFLEKSVYSLAERTLKFGTDFTIKSAGKGTLKRIAGLSKFHSIETL
jgi:hypothetical protein